MKLKRAKKFICNKMGNCSGRSLLDFTLSMEDLLPEEVANTLKRVEMGCPATNFSILAL